MTQIPRLRIFRVASTALLALALQTVAATATEPARDLRIDAVEVTDSSRDGVFQPGETLTVQVVISNPGDVPLGRRLRLSGPGLVLDDEQWVEVPAGAAVSLERPLAGILDPTLQARSETSLRLALGQTSRDLPVWISHPLELGGEIAVSAWNGSEASARVRIVVHNTSRKDSSAVLHARVAPGQLVESSKAVATIPAGSWAEVSFELTGVESDWVRDGRVALELTATALGRTHDRIAYGLREEGVALAENRLSAPTTF